MKLSQAFFDRPITHRGLHDKADGRPEDLSRGRKGVDDVVDHRIRTGYHKL